MSTNTPLGELLAQLAAATPAPGGGCAAAWTCAIAAGLVEMTARFTLTDPRRRERMTQIAQRACELRGRATALADAELHTYEPVLAALRLPRTDPDRAAALDAALSHAAQTPLSIAQLATELAQLALEAMNEASEHLRGDALTGVLLADAAAQAATRLVSINLAGRPDDPRRSEAGALAHRAARARSVADRGGG